MNTPDSVVLLSGGLDSCVTLAIAKDLGKMPFRLSFSYGQKHEKYEMAAARKVADHYKVPGVEVRINLEPLLYTSSSLINHPSAPKVPQGRSLEAIKADKGIPSTWVPGRNAIFLSIAAGYARSLGAEKVFIGANQVDYSGYPDCRKEFLAAMQIALNLALNGSRKNQVLTIIAPLVTLTKNEIVGVGRTLKAPMHLTWSCYNPTPQGQPCGLCDSCVIRQSALTES